MPAGLRPGRKGAPLSIEESRIRGIAQRALALFMAIVLATTLTPGLALAGEQSGADAKTEQAAPTNSETPGDSANERGSAASGNGDGGQDSGSSADQNDASDGNTAASNGTTANSLESKGKSANNESNSQTNTVSATLKISVYGTVLVSHSFDIEKGKTVEDLLNLAEAQGYIDSYSHGEPYEGYASYYVNSITLKGNAYTQPADYSEYWSCSVNGASDYSGINNNRVENDGFSYELNYLSLSNPDTKYDDGTGDYPVNPNTPNPDTARKNDTTSYVKSDGNTSAVTSAPTSSSNAALAWKKTYGNNDGCYSEVLTFADSVYMASSLYNADHSKQTAVLHQFNLNGEETASLQLFGTIDYTCRMVYTDGVIVIPLSDGRLQGVSSSQMKTMWVSNIIAAGDMSMSTVTASGGMVFTGTTSDWGASSGTFFGVNALTGKCVWANRNTEAGYYWAGACKIGNVLVFGDNAGVLKAVDPATGRVVSTLKLSSAIRSTVITNSAGTKAYVVTNDGTLHEIKVGFDGSLSKSKEVNFDANGSGAGAPTLFESNIYVGGGNYYSKGSFVVIDANTMQVKNTIELPFYSQSAPLVAKAADGKTYAYFTCNGAETNDEGKIISGGGAWVYCLETNTATKLFDATGDLANWCIKSITMGSDGTLYWTNDSGTLFALANASSSGDKDNQDKGKDDDQSDNNGDKDDQRKNAGNNSNSDDDKGGSPAKKTGGKSVAAKAPLSVSKASAEKGSSDSKKNSEPAQGTSASTSSAKSASSDDEGNNESQQIPWLPIAGIVVGCVGLVGVGTYLLRRRNL